jgi:hypothetical protein
MSDPAARYFKIISAALVLVSLDSVSVAFGSGCAPDNPDIAVSSGTVLNLSSSNFSASELNTAISYWTGCGNGTDAPSLTVGGSGGIQVSVTRIAGTSPTGRCGHSDIGIGATSHRIVSVDITIYTQQNNGASCNPLTDEIAHELGHALGLTDADSGSCRQHIMGFRDSGTTRSVGAEECDQVDQNWLLPGEANGGEGGSTPRPCV